MDSTLFLDSKLLNFTVLETSARKLPEPKSSKIDKTTKISIQMGLSIDDKKKGPGHEAIYDVVIKCLTKDDEPTLFSLKYKANAIYEFKTEAEDVDDILKNESKYFFRELYNLSRDHLNDTLDRLKTNFRVPLSIPTEFEMSITKD